MAGEPSPPPVYTEGKDFPLYHLLYHLGDSLKRKNPLTYMVAGFSKMAGREGFEPSAAGSIFPVLSIYSYLLINERLAFVRLLLGVSELIWEGSTFGST